MRTNGRGSQECDSGGGSPLTGCQGLPPPGVAITTRMLPRPNGTSIGARSVQRSGGIPRVAEFVA